MRTPAPKAITLATTGCGTRRNHATAAPSTSAPPANSPQNPACNQIGTITPFPEHHRRHLRSGAPLSPSPDRRATRNATATRTAPATAFEAVLDRGRLQPPPVRARLFATAQGLYEHAGFTEST
ncbi:hypothetical protein GCM10022223_15980 [Kineosporia mesophila]|uniref:Uncharacterized protein n=1 Tax=Kineosporia mesophila TaxID=566012 RepID=A0ABP6Z8F9_9ACTN